MAEHALSYEISGKNRVGREQDSKYLEDAMTKLFERVEIMPIPGRIDRLFIGKASNSQCVVVKPIGTSITSLKSLGDQDLTFTESNKSHVRFSIDGTDYRVLYSAD